MSSDTWNPVTLGEVVTLNYGKSLTASKRRGGDVPVYSSSGLIGWHDEALVDEEGIIVGRKGTVGSVYYSDRPFFCIDTAYYIKKSELSSDIQYTYYLLQTLGLEYLNEDSAVPGLNRDTAYSQMFDLPPLPTQRRIAAILSALDDKIELNRQTNATLEAIAQAIFKEWFVDFNFPGATGEMVEVGGESPFAQTGPIPQGWRVDEIGNVLDIVGGGTPSTKNSSFWDDGLHNFATPKDLSSLTSPILLSTERKVTDAGLAQISSGLLPSGTLLLSSRAPIGYLAISQEPVCINQGFIAIKPNGMLSNCFFLNWLTQNMEEIKMRASGTTFPEISKRNFRPIPIIIPSTSVLMCFDDLVNPLYARITENMRETQTLLYLREIMLPRLMAGEIEV